MTLLQSRKSLWGLAAIWDTASKVKTFNRSDADRTGRLLNLDAYNRPELCSGTLRFWKRQGWRFYPVNIRYLVPTTNIPQKGFPVMVFCLDQAATWNSDWVNFTAQLCLGGSVVIIVELPAMGETTRQQAKTFLEAAWLAIATRIGGLADIPVRLSWWGTNSTVPVVEQAARLRHYKYYLPPENILTRPFNEAAPAQEEVVVKELELVTV